MTARRAALAAALMTTFATALLPNPAHAADTQLSFSVLGEGAFTPEPGGHGAMLLAADVTNIGDQALSFAAVLNTETLRLQLAGIPLAERLWLELDATGELGFASLLPDYFLYGEKIPERGFFASYVDGGATLVWSPSGPHWIRLRAGVRRWFFGAGPNTADALDLPADVTAFSPTLAYTLWLIRDGDEFSERHRVFPRVVGFALGVEMGMSLRTNHDAWGTLDPALETGARNDPNALSLRPQGWLRAGTWIADNLRWQVMCEAAYGVGEDDITRSRVGGQNPYVVGVPGLAWGSFVSERYVGGDWSWHLRAAGQSEVGLRFAGAYLDDLDRTGESRGGALFGASVFADMRFGDWQVDTRLGWSPTVQTAGEDVRSGMSALVAFGYAQ